MTTWVLLRGLAREAGHWGNFPDRLNRALGRKGQVIALDTPGNGIFSQLQSPLSVAGMTQACRQELQRRRVQPPYILVAMSLGGMVAIEWSLIAPDEISGCALINTSLGGRQPFWERLRPQSYARLCRVFWSWERSPKLREATILELTTCNEQARADALPKWVELAERRPIRLTNALRQIWAAFRYRPSQRKPAVPMFVIFSKADALVSPTCSMRLAEQWQLATRVNPYSGHDIAVDAPLWLIDQLLYGASVLWANSAPAATNIHFSPSRRDGHLGAQQCTTHG